MTRSRRDSGHSHKRRVLFATGSMLVALAVVIVLAALYARPLLAGPALTRLVITGSLEHVSPQAVRAAVRPELGSGFFTTNVSAVRAAVAALPWVETASVRRSWPHTLYIEIGEETPVVRWNGDGLMDAQGHVFVRTGGQDWAQLSQLSGPDDSALAVLNEYHTYSALLATKGLTIRQMEMDARGSVTLTLSDGINVRLGRQQAEVRLERFAAVALPVLAAQLTRVAYVDMRYTNGFAVGWSRMISATCQWYVAPAKRRHMDVAAGRPAMDGSENCASTCAAAGQSTSDGPGNCGADCVAAGQSSGVGSRQCAINSEVKSSG